MKALPISVQACPGQALNDKMQAALRSAPRVERAGPFPRDWWQHLASERLLGLGFDVERHGEPVGWAAIASLSGVIARETASVGLALAWLMNEMLGRFVIAPNAENDGHRSLLRMMARGKKIAALAISEPRVGAHPKHLNCRASRPGDHWLLAGEKSYVSNGPAADVFIVLAVTGEAAGRKMFDTFIVDADAPGLTRLATGRQSALAPLGHCGLAFDACPVARARRLGTDGRAYERIAAPLRTLEDTLLAGTMIGAMQAELGALASWLRGTAPTPARLRSLGALRLELAALARLAVVSAEQLEAQGVDDQLADLNAGLRLALERWQNNCDAVAAPLDDHAPELLNLGRDIRTVLSIARSIGEARHLMAGSSLLDTKEHDEVPA
jgi:acyl-CoA dehydrogenase